MSFVHPELASHLRGLAPTETNPVVARRLEIVADYHSGMMPAEIAHAYGVSPVLVLDAMRRFESGGIDALRERSAVLVPAPHVETRPVAALETVGLDADELARLAEREQDGEVARRLLTVSLVASGLALDEVSKRTGLSRSKVSRCVAAYRSGGIEALRPKVRRASPYPCGAAEATVVPVTTKRRKPKETLLRCLIEGCDPEQIRALAAYQLDPRAAKDLLYAAEVAAGCSYAEAAEAVGGYPLHHAYRPVAELVDLLARVANDDLPAVAKATESGSPLPRSYVSDQARELAARADAEPDHNLRRRLKAVAAVLDTKHLRHLVGRDLWDGGDLSAVARRHGVRVRRVRAWVGEFSARVRQAA